MAPKLMKRPWLLVAAPATLLLVLVCWPLISGQSTLFLRDALNVHLGMKAAQAHLQEESGEGVPLVAPQLAGGQPMAGNPNAVPFYPDNVLYRLGSTLWAFNAHFWLHLLLAPWAMAWLGRTWGLRPEAAWGAGVFYATGGFFLSQMNFYNLVAGAALAPALAAATLVLAREPKGRHVALLGGLWALILLSGEPLMAGIALLLALLGALVSQGRGLLNGKTVSAFFAAFAFGTLAAAPQLVELLRVLPLSYRGHRGYSLASSTAGSFHPWQALEWLVPLGFGRPDQLREGAFWGYPYYSGLPPFFFSLAPGLLVLALIAVSGLKRKPLRLWAWAAIGGGLFFALGRFNPLVELLLQLPGAGLLRYPVKVWLAVAMGTALLAGLSLERVLEDDRSRRRLLAALGTFGVGYGLVWGWLTLAPASASVTLRKLIPDAFGATFLSLEVSRWSLLTLLSGLAALALAATFFWAGRRPLLAGVTAVTLSAAVQLLFLSPTLAMDDASAYEEEPEVLAHLPAAVPIVNGSSDQLFGPVNLKLGDYPEASAQWIARRTFQQAYPFAGILHGRRYELNLTPEGLSSFLTRAARDAIQQLSDPGRIRLLRSWGVGRLVLQRPLSPDALHMVRLLARQPSFGNEVFVYEILASADEVYLANRQIFAPHLNAALTTLTNQGFDPGNTVVLPGDNPPRKDLGGTILNVEKTAQSISVEVEAREDTFLLWQRSHLPLYLATVDSFPAQILAGNLHRIAVPVPKGRHLVEIFPQRAPLHRSRVASALGMLGLLGLALVDRSRSSRESLSGKISRS